MKRFWKWLEVRRDLTAVMSQWQSVAGDFYPVVASMFKVSQNTATVFPNLGGMPMKIVHHADKTIVAVDSEDVGNKVLLTSADIILHRLDLGLLRKTICDALSDVNIARTSIDLKSRCHHVGYWEPKKAAKFPIYLLLCPTMKNLKYEILQCQYLCNRGGAILLTPTRDKWNEDIEQLAKSRKMILVALSEILTCRDGGFVATENWTEYLEAFCQLVETTLPQNYRTPKPRPKRTSRMNVIDKLEKELDAHLIAARDYAHSYVQKKQPPRLLPKPDQKDLAKKLDVSESAVSRALNDEKAKVLKILWDTADDIDAIMKYKTRRQ